MQMPVTRQASLHGLVFFTLLTITPPVHHRSAPIALGQTDGAHTPEAWRALQRTGEMVGGSCSPDVTSLPDVSARITVRRTESLWQASGLVNRWQTENRWSDGRSALQKPASGMVSTALLAIDTARPASNVHQEGLRSSGGVTRHGHVGIVGPIRWRDQRGGRRSAFGRCLAHLARRPRQRGLLIAMCSCSSRYLSSSPGARVRVQWAGHDRLLACGRAHHTLVRVPPGRATVRFSPAA